MGWNDQQSDKYLDGIQIAYERKIQLPPSVNRFFPEKSKFPEIPKIGPSDLEGDKSKRGKKK